MAKKASGKPEDQRRTQVTIKHKLTVEEYRERTAQLTQLLDRYELKEQQLKAQQATGKAELKDMKSQITDLKGQLQNETEDRVVQATVEFNPKKGSKSFFHFCPENPSTHRTHIRDEAMTQDDYGQLPIGDGAQKVDTAKQPAPEHKQPDTTAEPGPKSEKSTEPEGSGDPGF